MVIRPGWILSAIFAVSVVLLAAHPASAGVVYTDEADFNTAVAALGLVPSWSEGFEGMPTGAVTDPLLLSAGLAAVGGGFSAAVGDFGGPTGQSWSNGSGGATVRGAGNTGLGLRAISFDFGSTGSQTVSFVGTGGTETSAVFSANGATTDSFVGWVATGDETVLTAQFDQPGSITLDNLDAFVAHAPEPGTFLLFGIGAAGLYLGHRRRKNRKTA